MVDATQETTRQSPVTQQARPNDSSSNGRVLPLPVVIYTLAMLLPIFVQLGGIGLPAQRFVLAILFVPMFFQLYTGRAGKVLFVDILILMHMGWSALAILLINPHIFVQFSGSNTIDFLGGYLLARLYIRNADQFQAFVKLLCTLVVILLPISVYEAVIGTPIVNQILSYVPAIGVLEVVPGEPRLGLRRVQSVFAHPIHHGLFGSITFALIFNGLKGEISNVMRWFYAVVAGAVCFLALSSGAILALMLQVGLILWATIFARVQIRWMLLFGLFVVLYIIIDLLSTRTPIEVFMSFATFNPWTAYWRALIFEYGMQNVLANPIFGIGLNDWVRPFWMFTDSVDNFWLVMAMRYGIPGFILLAVPVVIVIFKVGLRNLDGNERLLRYRRAWMFVIVGMVFTLCTVHVWGQMYSFTFMVFGAGYWFMTVDPKEGLEHAAETEVVENPEDRVSRYTRFATTDAVVADRASTKDDQAERAPYARSHAPKIAEDSQGTREARRKPRRKSMSRKPDLPKSRFPHKKDD